MEIEQISSGIVSRGVEIKSDCRLYVDRGGILHDAVVSNGGELILFAGGTATGIIAKKGARLDFSVVPGTCLQGISGGRMFKMSDGIMSGFQFNRHYDVLSGGTAVSSIITSALTVREGGMAEKTIISSGLMLVAGVANNTIISSGGSINVLSGGTATNIIAEKGSEISFEVAKKTRLQGASAGSAFEISGGFVSNDTLRGFHPILNGGRAIKNMLEGTVDVKAGGTVRHTTVCGTLRVEEGGIATDTIISKGGLVIVKGGTARKTTVSSEGRYEIRSGAAYGIKVSSCGRVTVMGGIAEKININKGCDFLVFSGGTARETIISGDNSMLAVTYGGVAVDTTIKSGILYIRSGGMATGVNVSNKGMICVESGGSACEIKAANKAQICSNCAPGSFIDKIIRLNIDSSLHPFIFREKKSEFQAESPDNSSEYYKFARDCTTIKIAKDNLIGRKLAEIALNVIPDRVAYYAPIVGVSFSQIIIEKKSGRLGSCSPCGVLTFNCELVLAALDVLDSVIVHELCHRRVMGHSEKFWAEVFKNLPDYWERHKQLKTYCEKYYRIASIFCVPNKPF